MAASARFRRSCEGTFALPARMKGMRVLLVVVLAACSAGVADVPSASSDDRDAAIAMAKTCIAKNGYTTVWKTPLVMEKLTATHVEGRKWAVGGPESGVDANGNAVQLGKPSGLMVDIDLDAQTCRKMMLE